MLDEFYRNPPYYDAIRRRVYRLKGEYGPYLRAFPIGKSVLGRGIFALSTGSLRGATLFVGGVHGQEWITTLLLFCYFERLMQSLKNSTPLQGRDMAEALAGRALAVVPCLNPDGVEIALRGPEGALHSRKIVEQIWQPDRLWQANARGVDLNHNFDAGWQTLQQLEQAAGITGPAPAGYGGPRPMSEPETRAVACLCQTFDLQKVYAFHAQGEEIYYEYGPYTPVCSQSMAQQLAELSGYRLSAPTGTAAHGGLKDWFIQHRRRPGFTIEVGRGQNPLPIGQLPALYERLEPLLAQASLP